MTPDSKDTFAILFGSPWWKVIGIVALALITWKALETRVDKKVDTIRVELIEARILVIDVKLTALLTLVCRSHPGDSMCAAVR